MPKASAGLPENAAWLRDSTEARMLHVTARAAAPQAGRLSMFAPDFALNDAAPWLTGEEVAWPLAMTPELIPPLVSKADPSAAAFNVMFEDIAGRIHADEFTKVVPVVIEELEFASAIDARMFPRVFDEHPHQFSFGFQSDGEGLCGITPELLFAVEDGVLHTMALAGTGRVDGPDLLADPKERREHELVIDHIVAELRAYGAADVGLTTERAYGLLKHLYTPIRLELDRLPSFMDLVVRLHPTAALGGFPRRPAVEWLQRQAFHVARNRFGAPFGLIDGDHYRCVVAIRSVQWRDRLLTLASGCGIVAASEVMNEWRELELKRRAIYENLGLPT